MSDFSSALSDERVVLTICQQSFDLLCKRLAFETVRFFSFHLDSVELQSLLLSTTIAECVQRPNQLRPNYLETLNDLMVTTYRRTEFFITFHVGVCKVCTFQLRWLLPHFFVIHCDRVDFTSLRLYFPHKNWYFEIKTIATQAVTEEQRKKWRISMYKWLKEKTRNGKAAPSRWQKLSI